MISSSASQDKVSPISLMNSEHSPPEVSATHQAGDFGLSIQYIFIALPSYAADEEERATTRYLALTTIATFFSSITATTLQFSYQQTTGRLSSAVNLFWFLSLVFSVSSGINSLLSMIWRKSTVYALTFLNKKAIAEHQSQHATDIRTSNLQSTSTSG